MSFLDRMIASTGLHLRRHAYFEHQAAWTPGCVVTHSARHARLTWYAAGQRLHWTMATESPDKPQWQQ